MPVRRAGMVLCMRGGFGAFTGRQAGGWYAFGFIELGASASWCVSPRVCDVKGEGGDVKSVMEGHI